MLININYHYVRPAFDAPFPGIHGITPAQLESQLRVLSTIGEFVSGHDVARAAVERRTLPARCFLATFDDGFLEQYEHAWPVLERLGIPAMFFVNSRPIEDDIVSCVHQIHLLRSQCAPEEFADRLFERAAAHGFRADSTEFEARAAAHYRYDTPAMAWLKHFLNIILPRDVRETVIEEIFIERHGDDHSVLSQALYMRPEQIADLASRNMVGNHGHDHIPLAPLSKQELHAQLEKCNEFVERVSGRRPFAVSYPFGTREATPAAIAPLADELGLVFGLTMERAGNPDLMSPHYLARLDNNDAPLGKASKWQPEEMFDAVPHRKWFLN